jgi:hypothetical protein
MQNRYELLLYSYCIVTLFVLPSSTVLLKSFVGLYEPLQYDVINTVIFPNKISLIKRHIQRAWWNYIMQAP